MRGNVLVQQAPLAFLHHTSWQVNDIDEVSRGATMMLEKDPARHVWGLGRHRSVWGRGIASHPAIPGDRRARAGRAPLRGWSLPP